MLCCGYLQIILVDERFTQPTFTSCSAYRRIINASGAQVSPLSSFDAGMRLDELGFSVIDILITYIST